MKKQNQELRDGTAKYLLTESVKRENKIEYYIHADSGRDWIEEVVVYI